MTDYFRNQCPARGPGLTHTLEGTEGDPCVICGTRLTVQPPSARLPATASEARRTLGLRNSGATMYPQPQRPRPEPEHDDNTPVEPRAITGHGPQGRPHGVGRGEFTQRDAKRVIAHVEYRRWLGQHGGGEEQ